MLNTYNDSLERKIRWENLMLRRHRLSKFVARCVIWLVVFKVNWLICYVSVTNLSLIEKRQSNLDSKSAKDHIKIYSGNQTLQKKLTKIN